MWKRDKLPTRSSASVLLVAGGLLFNQAVQATCITPDPLTFSAPVTVLAVDAGSGCSNITGQTGFTVDDSQIPNAKPATPIDFTFPNGNTMSVFVWFGPDGRVLWEAVDDPSDPTVLGPKTVVMQGAAGGANNCGYVYSPYDAFAGEGGDLKSNGTFQNSTGVDFCSDGVKNELPEEEEPLSIDGPLPFCGNDPETGGRSLDEDGFLKYAGGALDEIDISCPTCSAWLQSDLPADVRQALYDNCEDGIEFGSSLCINVPEFDEDGKPVPGTGCNPPPISLVVNLEEMERNLGIDDGEWACFCNLQPERNTVCRTDVRDDDPESCVAKFGGIDQFKDLEIFGATEENPPAFWRNGRCYGC